MKKILLQHVRIAPHLHRAGVLLLLALTLLGTVGSATAETKNRADFNHLKTGFPLTGVHARQKCEDCHVQGIFKGTPTQCSGCHASGSRIASTSKPANHISTAMACGDCHTSSVSWVGARFTHIGVSPGTCNTCHGVTAIGKPAKHISTTAQCDVCHRTTAWIPATFSHASVTPGTCNSCHGVNATGKPNKHISTTAQCDVCHRTTAWIPATFSHASVTPGTCNSCHGVNATGKPNKHITTTAQCDACHRTTAWIPATFSHASVTPGTCNSCHGVNATGKPNKHISTTAQCDVCHRTTAWIPATFSHANVTPGTCSACHGVNATGKPSGHFMTSRSCDACHSTNAWAPTIRYNHTSPAYVQHNTGVTCINCHTTKNEVIPWRFSAYKPDCAGCHADRYRPDPHKKTETPTTIFYTVLELRNCSGSCHQYNDSSFTSIKKSRSGEHRSTGGGF